MAKQTYRAVGRVKGISKKPLEHGQEIALESDDEQVEKLVAAGALVDAKAPEAPEPGEERKKTVAELKIELKAAEKAEAEAKAADKEAKKGK